MTDLPGDRFEHPLTERYASREMAQLFSPRSRHGRWRDLWIALAEAEHELGLDITAAQLAELRQARDTFDFARVAQLEKELRHDVMAHIHHYGELAPAAKGILHLGATSCFVTDNGDLLLYREGLRQLEQRLVRACAALAAFARQWRAEPCLGYTHFQPAQPVTVGKRATLWLFDLLLDLDEVRRVIAWLPARGVKGTTGTQASFLALFDGDHAKVQELERRVMHKVGFTRWVAVSGQTYTRKLDWTIHQVLCGIAQSAAKFGCDLRLLAHEGEVEEPSESKQVGSSAMAYKKNPMRAERICSLARYVIAATTTSAATAATQWLERTLDDSAVKRIALPESFLACDAILILVENVAKGLVVWPKVVAQNLAQELPFMATEEILMAAVRKGGDRQQLHERIRVHSRAAAHQIKAEGRPNPLLGLIGGDPAFAGIVPLLAELVAPQRFVGRSPQQVDEFLAAEVEPRLRGSGASGGGDELRV